MKPKIPQIIKDVGFDFSWDAKKVWGLEEPTGTMSVSELDWHFEIPFLNSDAGVYDLKPADVLEYPEKYQREFARTMQADMIYPIDIMKNKGRWLILDGLHRLMQARVSGQDEVDVRVIPRERIGEIEVER